MIFNNRRVALDLGQVGDAAHVKVKACDFATLWNPPCRIDVTEAVRTGENHPEIAVVTAESVAAASRRKNTSPISSGAN